MLFKVTHFHARFFKICTFFVKLHFWGKIWHDLPIFFARLELMQLQITNFLQDHTFFLQDFQILARLQFSQWQRFLQDFYNICPFYFKIVIFLHMILQELQFFLVQDCQFLCEIAKFCNKPPILGVRYSIFSHAFPICCKISNFWGRSLQNLPFWRPKFAGFLQCFQFFCKISNFLPKFPRCSPFFQPLRSVSRLCPPSMPAMSPPLGFVWWHLHGVHPALGFGWWHPLKVVPKLVFGW